MSSNNEIVKLREEFEEYKQSGYWGRRDVLKAVGAGLLGLEAVSIFSKPASAATSLNAEIEASYVIFAKDNMIYAQNGSTGYIDFSGMDAATIINNTLNKLTSGRTWKEKVVIKGNFTISATIYVPSCTVLDISQAILTLADSVNNCIIQNKNSIDNEIEIIGGNLNGNHTNQASGIRSGIRFLNVSNFIIKGVEITNCNNQGIDIVGTDASTYSHDFIISENYCHANGFGGIYIGYYSRKGIISGNICNENGGHGTTDDNGIYLGDTVYEIVIDGNVCIGNIYNGIQIYSTGTSTKSIVSNNFCSDNDNGDIVIQFSTDNTITGNVCYGNDKSNTGIYMEDADNTIVSSNYINNAQFNGMTIWTSDHCTISNNVVVESGNYGIKLGDCNFTTVNNNVVRDSGQAANNTYSEIILDNYLLGNTYCSIIGNITNATLSNKSMYGILQDAKGNNCLITNNICQNSATANMSILGTKNVVNNNIGYKTENKGATSIADGGTIAHGLAVRPNYANAITSVNGEFASITAIDATKITVAIKKHDNKAGTRQTIYWEVKV